MLMKYTRYLKRIDRKHIASLMQLRYLSRKSFDKNMPSNPVDKSLYVAMKHNDYNNIKYNIAKKLQNDKYFYNNPSSIDDLPNYHF
jgi:hypothetical protein